MLGALVRGGLLAVLVTSVLFQPALALVASAGPGSARVVVTRLKEEAPRCCCRRASTRTTCSMKGESGCSCSLMPTAPADAPLPLFSPPERLGGKVRALASRIDRVFDAPLVCVLDSAPGPAVGEALELRCSDGHSRAGPPPRGMPGGLITHLAELQIARL